MATRVRGPGAGWPGTHRRLGDGPRPRDDTRPLARRQSESARHRAERPRFAVRRGDPDHERVHPGQESPAGGDPAGWRPLRPRVPAGDRDGLRRVPVPCVRRRRRHQPGHRRVPEVDRLRFRHDARRLLGARTRPCARRGRCPGDDPTREGGRVAPGRNGPRRGGPRRPPRRLAGAMRAGGLLARCRGVRDRRRRAAPRIVSVPRSRPGHHRIEEGFGPLQAGPSVRRRPSAHLPARHPPRVRPLRLRIVREVRSGRPHALPGRHPPRIRGPGERLPVSRVHRPLDRGDRAERGAPRGAQPARVLRRDPGGPPRDRRRGPVGARGATRSEPSRAPRRAARTPPPQRFPGGVRADLAPRRSLSSGGRETPPRPTLPRSRRRLAARSAAPPAKGLLVLPEGPRPFAERNARNVERVLERADVHIVVKSVWGPVPLELDHLWPMSQCVVPESLDVEALEAAEVFFREWAAGAGFPFGLLWEGDTTLDELRTRAPGGRTADWNTLRIRATADFQFGRGAADALLTGTLSYVTSKNTGKIRNVHVNGEHVLSLRAEDGLFTLKVAGARRLSKAFPAPKLRIVVDEDAVPFHREGKNVFAKFVLDADPEIHRGDEALVVSPDDELCAVAQASMNQREMLAFKRGVAAHVREGVPPAPSAPRH